MSEAQTVLADSQYGTQTVFRPQEGFSTLYQGQNCRRPLYLFPSVPGSGKVETVDPLSKDGTPGYAANLTRGLSVPMGSRCLLWFPSPFYQDGETRKGYEYVLLWRLRNLFDYRNDRRPYHVPTTKGQKDTASNQTLVAIPTAVEAITYKQDEPSGDQRDFSQIHMRPSSISSATTPVAGHLLAGGTLGPVQQGIMDPALSGAALAQAASFLPYETTCKGDELLIGIRRSGGPGSWDFEQGGDDVNLLLYLRESYQYSGVYVFTGSASSFNTGDLATGGASIS